MTSERAGDQVSKSPTDSTLVKATSALGGHDRLYEAARRFVGLGDAGPNGLPLFMTCESGGKRGPMIVLKCNDLSHAHAVQRAIIDIVHAVRQS